MNITTEMVKELRDQTKVSIMQCKKALEEAGGDMEKAIMVLRKVSAATAAKKSDRELGAGIIGSYTHNNRKVAAIVEVQCETDFVAQNPEVMEFANNLAMHIVAMNPQYVSAEEISAEETEKAKEFFLEEIGQSDKPAEIQEKILSGKMNDFFSEKTLMNQAYIMNGDMTIADIVNGLTQKTGERVVIGKFSRFEIV
jgi:elongation factor Ts